MTKKVGRNDPCWCGSQRKLKKCHGTAKAPVGRSGALRVAPARVPEAITSHLVQKDGRLEKRDGLLQVRIIGRDVKSTDEELVSLRTKWGLAQEGAKASPRLRRLNRQLRDVQHKLEAVRYHRDNFQRHEDHLIAKFQTDHVPPAGAELALEEPQLIFEIEGFLYQAKSSLDMLAQLAKDAGFGSMSESFGNHGDRVIKALASPPANCTVQAASMEAAIRAAQTTWLDECVAMRDTIAHQGMLKELTCFRQEPHVGDPTATIHYPEMPNGQRARAYLERTERELRAFADKFIGLAIECAGKISK